MFASRTARALKELSTEAWQKERDLTVELAKLRRDIWNKERVISYLMRRPHLESGSLEMAQGDAMCEKLGYKPYLPVK